MSANSSLPEGLLRPGLPRGPSFTVSEIADAVKLDQNESPFELPQELKESILQSLAATDWRRYPQPVRYQAIKQRFAAAIGQPAERVVLTAGGDQMILGSYWLAGGAGRRARVFEPTYPMFAAYARITATELDQVVLGADFELMDLGEPVNLLHLVCPNNPTGRGPRRAQIQQAAERWRTTLVFVDEAYADYAGESVVDLTERYPNLLVGRSLSKSMLAGVRLGYGVGHPELVATLERMLFAPYHLSALQLTVAEQMDAIRPLLAQRVAQVKAERERVAAALTALGLRVWPSKGNFLLFGPADAGRCNEGLLQRRVRVRDVSGLPGLDNHLRVTIGTRGDNDRFLAALAQSV